MLLIRMQFLKTFQNVCNKLSSLKKLIFVCLCKNWLNEKNLQPITAVHSSAHLTSFHINFAIATVWILIIQMSWSVRIAVYIIKLEADSVLDLFQIHKILVENKNYIFGSNQSVKESGYRARFKIVGIITFFRYLSLIETAIEVDFTISIYAK